MKKWVDQQTFDELLLANAEDAEKDIQQRKDSHTSYLENLRKFVPDAGFFYFVSHNEETHQNSFISMSIGFRRNEILFFVNIQTYPKTFYTLRLDISSFKFIDRYSLDRVLSNVPKPNRIGVLSHHKIDEWVEYNTYGYRNLEKINAENERKITSFRERLEALPDVQWDSSSSGSIIRGGMEYKFEIYNTHYNEQILLKYSISTLDDFLAVSNNKYVPKTE